MKLIRMIPIAATIILSLSIVRKILFLRKKKKHIVKTA